MPSVREQKKSKTHTNGLGFGSRVLRSWHWLWDETDPHPVAHPSGAPDTDKAETSETEGPNLITGIAPLKIIAWLGASAGGLTILLGAIGFLASSAHDVMLGIPRSFQTNSEHVAVGGLFFGRSIIFLVASLVSLRSWVVLGILLAAVFVFFKLPRRLSRGRSLVIGVVAIVLLLAEIYGLLRLTRPLQLSNLLLNLSVDANTPGRQIADALLVKDTTWLSAEYGFLVLLTLAFSIAFILLERESQDRQGLRKGRESRTLFWHLARIPALILLVICIFLLPRAYGVLTISNDYPTISIESVSPSGGNATNETRLLLHEDDKVLVLYDPAAQSILTIKRDSIAQQKIYAPQHVFTASVVRK